MRLILGSPGSGKTTRVIESVCAELSADRRPLLVIPTRYLKDRFTAELASRTNGFAGTAVITLTELVAKVVESAGLSETVRTITDFESFLLVREILENNRGRLEYFRDAVQFDGMVNLLYSLVIELRASSMMNDGGEYSQVLDAKAPKHRDVAFLYSEYVSRLVKQGLLDAYGLYAVASKALDDGLRLEHDSLWFDGFYEFTRSQFRFAASLIRNFGNNGLPAAASVQDVDHPVAAETLALWTDEFDCETERLGGAARSGYASLEKLTLTEIEGFGKYREVELAANEIKRLVREEGYAYSDVAVLTRDPETYAAPIRALFAQYEIPYYASKDETLKSNPVVILLYSLVRDSIFGVDNVSLMGVARSSYVTNDAVRKLASVNEFVGEYLKGDARVWMNELGSKKRFYEYLLNDPSAAERMEKDFDVLEIQADYNRLTAFEPFLEDFLSTLFALSDGKPHTVDEWSLWLSGLVAKLGIQKALNDFELTNRYPVVTKDFMAFRKLKESLKALKKSLAIFGKEAVTAPEFYRILTDLISEVRYRYRFYPADSVKVLTPADSKETSFRAVFVLGLNEGEFPKNAPLSVLDHGERRRINEAANRLILDDETRSLKLQKLDFVIAVNRARERLYLCRTPFDESGEFILPSGFSEGLIKLAGTDKVRHVHPKADGARYSDLIFKIVPSQTWMNIEHFRTLVSNDFDVLFDRRSPKTFMEWAKKHPLLEGTRRMADYYSRFVSANEFFTKGRQEGEDALILTGRVELDPASASDEAIREYVSGKLASMKLSASKLETAGNCRHQFFIKYILGVREEINPEQTIELRLQGAILHRALELYVASTQDAPKDSLPDFGTLDRCVADALTELLRKENESFLMESETAYYRSVLRAVALEDAKLRDDYSPKLLEHRFTDAKVALPGGRVLLFDGAIDRADRSGSGAWRIIDYKTGNVNYIDRNAKIPLKLFQGALYAGILLSEEGDSSPVDSILYLSLLKFDDNLPVRCELLKKDKTFDGLWELKKREITLLLGLLDDGNFMPYTTVDDFGSDPAILDEYFKKTDEPLDLESLDYGDCESDSKCKFCGYRDACLRIDKPVGEY